MALVTLIFLVQINETGSSFFSAETSQPFVLEIIWLTGSALLIAAGIGISIFWRNKTNYTASDIAGLILIGVTTPLFSIIGADNLPTAILLAVAVFLISLWLITYGQGFADRTFVNLGFVLFGAETLYIYFKTFGTLMNSFVFFTIGGIVLILLALGLERFRKRILNTPIEPGVSANA